MGQYNSDTLEGDRESAIKRVDNALGILSQELSENEKWRISNLGLDPNNEQDLELLRDRLITVRGVLQKAVYFDATVENLKNDPFVSAFFSQTSEAGNKSIQEYMHDIYFGEPSRAKEPALAFVYKQSPEKAYRTYIVSLNYFGSGRDLKNRANTLIHEASHLGWGTLDKGGKGIDNAYEFSKWVTLRPDPK